MIAGIEPGTYCVILSAGAMLIFSVLFQIDQMSRWEFVSNFSTKPRGRGERCHILGRRESDFAQYIVYELSKATRSHPPILLGRNCYHAAAALQDSNTTTQAGVYISSHALAGRWSPE